MNINNNLYSYIFCRRRVSLLFILTLLVCINSSDCDAATTATPTDWQNIVFFESANTDFQAASYPAKARASVPNRSDILTGTETLAFWGYYDGGTTWDGIPNSISMRDDYVGFSVRIDEDPGTGHTGFKSSYWYFLIDTDGDGSNEFSVYLDGLAKRGANGADKLRILYNSDNSKLCTGPKCFQVSEFTACTDTFDEAGPSSDCLNSHTRAFDAGDGTGEYYIQGQVPITAFVDSNGTQILFPDHINTCGDLPCNFILF